MGDFAKQVALPALCLGAPCAAYHSARLTACGVCSKCRKEHVPGPRSPRNLPKRNGDFETTVLPGRCYRWCRTFGPATAVCLTGSLVLEKSSPAEHRQSLHLLPLCNVDYHARDGAWLLTYHRLLFHHEFRSSIWHVRVSSTTRWIWNEDPSSPFVPVKLSAAERSTQIRPDEETLAKILQESREIRGACRVWQDAWRRFATPSSGDVLVVFLTTFGFGSRAVGVTPAAAVQSPVDRISINRSVLATQIDAVVLGGRAAFEIRKRTIERRSWRNTIKKPPRNVPRFLQSRGTRSSKRRKLVNAGTLGQGSEHPLTSLETNLGRSRFTIVPLRVGDLWWTGRFPFAICGPDKLTRSFIAGVLGFPGVVCVVGIVATLVEFDYRCSVMSDRRYCGRA